MGVSGTLFNDSAWLSVARTGSALVAPIRLPDLHVLNLLELLFGALHLRHCRLFISLLLDSVSKPALRLLLLLGRLLVV